jgi:predicted nucleic acid-binding protein
LLPDEESEYGEAVAARARLGQAHAPDLLRIEAANGLLVAHRRGRLDENALQDALRYVLSLPITSEASDSHSLSRATALAVTRSIAVYDAIYIEMASRLALPIATVDENLRAVAVTEGISIYEIPAMDAESQ